MVMEDQFSAAPDFALQDMSGRMVRLSEFKGKKHVILMFARGFA